MTVAVKQERHYAYEDYARWDDYPRCELIDGEVYMMSSPSQAHQEISMELGRQLANYLRGKSCKVFNAPFDVRLNPLGKDNTVGRDNEAPVHVLEGCAIYLADVFPYEEPGTAPRVPE